MSRTHYMNGDGEHIFKNAASSAGAATIRSEKFTVPDYTVFSTQFEFIDDAASYEAAVTLWASNVARPGDADDSDWVQMDAAHGFTGLPGGDPAGGGDVKTLPHFAVAAALWYRWKVERSAGSAVVNAYAIRKRG